MRKYLCALAVVAGVVPAMPACGAGAPARTGPDRQVADAPMDAQISAITLGVRDLETSYHFYKDGLGLPTTMAPGQGIVMFSTMGTKLFLYEYAKLAADAGVRPPAAVPPPGFAGFTLGHAVRARSDVDRILALAVKSGGTLVKPAGDTSWGGYSGYFRDPDGYLWEVLYAPNLRFAPDGTVIVP